MVKHIEENIKYIGHFKMNVTENFQKNVTKEINLDDLYSALVECFFIILCGYAAGRLNLISQREIKGLDVFVRTFSLPSIIFLSLAQLNMSTVNWGFLASILISKSIVFLGVLAVTTCLIRPTHYGKLGLYAVFCTQSNDFALGYPILCALYGKDHPDYPSYVYLLAPISLTVLNPVAYILLELGKFQKEKEKGNGLMSAAEVHKPKLLVTNADNESVERTVDEPSSSLGEELSQSAQNGIQERKSGAKLSGMVFLNIITNPVMFMTVLGICGNFIYSYIAFVGIVLKPFASVFSTTALFVLGLRMVGTVNKLKSDTLVTSGILIITKLLVLPLVTREIVSLLRPGINANDTLNLSSFGFIYGTFPSAPLVFVLSTQYDLEIESISSSLVVCTFLSAPLMYISAKMIFLDFIPTIDYSKKLESFQFNIGIFGIPLAFWLIITFIANKSFSKIPHKLSGFLIISQVLLCVGVALKPLVSTDKLWFEYIQVSIVALGLYSSRLWTFILALTLVILQSRSLCFVIKLIRFFTILAWGLPIILVVIMCFISYPDHLFESLINPTFRYGIYQSAVTFLLLSVPFVGTSVCLILQHRYQRKFASYLVLVQEINSKDLQEVNETNMGETSRDNPNSPYREQRRTVTDIEEIVPYNDGNICSGDCENEDLCSSKFNCTDSQRELCEETLKQYNDKAVNEDMDEDHQDRQILKHVVLSLLLVTSMFVNLMLSIWTLVINDAISGVYLELMFLNIMLNIGQVYLTFAVFGFESRGLIVSFKNRWRKFYYGADTVVLPPVEELGFETTHVCHQFIAHHLRECEKEIAKSKRLRLRIYQDCFKGQSLVNWLQTKCLAKNEEEAVQYASHLLEGRVLRHVENRHHFENSDLLYTFKQ